MEPTDYEQKKREFKKKMLAGLFKTKKALVNYENDIFNYTFDRAYILGKQAKDAEGEEMLMVSRKKLQEVYNKYANYVGYKLQPLLDLFGSKYLPDEVGNEDNLATKEPKFKRGDRVCIVSLHGRPTPNKGDVDVVAHINTGNDEQRYYLENHYSCAYGFSETDLELYTETTFTDTITNDCKSRNISQETANCDKYHIPDSWKMIDNILKDSFAKERRLNIAAMMAQAILSRIDDTPQVIAETAFRHADALIAECESKH